MLVLNRSVVKVSFVNYSRLLNGRLQLSGSQPVSETTAAQVIYTLGYSHYCRLINARLEKVHPASPR